MQSWIERVGEKATKYTSFLGPLLGRLTIGLVFLVSGWGKLHNLDHVTEFFTSLGIPAPHFQAVLVASTEFFGGLFLMIGLASRLVSIPLAITMTVALVTAKASEIEDLASLAGQLEFMYLVVFLWIAITGPGAASLDRLIVWAVKRRLAKKKAPPERELSDGAVPALAS